MHLLTASFLLLILLLPSPQAHMINSMFVGVRLCAVEVVGIRGIRVFCKSGKGCRITSCPCALFPNGQLSESCKSPSLWQMCNPHHGRHSSTVINTIFLQYFLCFSLARTKLAAIVIPSRSQAALTFIVVQFSVAVMYIDCFIQMTSFPVKKGFTSLPVKTMLCPVVSVGKSFHTVCAGLQLFFPSHRPWCYGNMYAVAEVCVCLGKGCWRALSICGII